MFESANFIDKENSHKSDYHKASKTTYNRVKIHLKLLKQANSGDKCDKVFINKTLKWYHVLIYSKISLS